MIKRVAFFLVATLFLCVSCGSSKKVVNAGYESLAAVTETDEEPKKPTKEEKAEAKRLEKEAKKARKADEKRRKREVTDKYLGVVYTPEKKYDLKSGKVHIALMGNTGSFNVYAVDAKKKETAIFSTADDSSSSYFSVLVGRHEYRLNRSASVETQVRQKEDGGQIAYFLEKYLQFVLDFSTAASVVDGADDMVKISVYTTNLSENRQTLAIKAVLDTVLGENLDYHFILANGTKIDAESQITAFDDNRYFVSTNQKVFAQFLVNGKTILSPERVAFANRDALAQGLWVPVITESKSFSTVLAYNNSAVSINWPYFSVDPGETNSFTFYIALNTEGEIPKGLDFIDTLTDEVQKGQTVNDTSTGTGITVKKPDVDFVLAPISDDQLDPAYIQNLIDRINSLSSDPALVDRTELRQLNAELDAILDRIRQLNQR